MTPGIIIVCHATPQWGFGHLHRSLALAMSAYERGWRVYLVTRGPKALIDPRVPSSLATCGVPEDAPLASEFECFTAAYEALRDHGADRLRAVVDHPHLDSTYADSLAALGLPWLTFSQCNSPPGTPSWVVSPLTAKEQGVEGERVDTHWLEGPAYSIVRPVFKEGCPHPYRPLNERRRLILTFGGGRDFGASELFLPPILDAFPELNIEVITTRSNNNLNRIKALVDHHHCRNLTLTVEPEEIALHMCEAGAAITAGGTTTVELAALGIPFITVAVASNQELPSMAWENRGVSFHAGNLESEAVVERVLGALQRLLENPDECLERSRRGREYVDGRGAHRILDHLTEEV